MPPPPPTSCAVACCCCFCCCLWGISACVTASLAAHQPPWRSITPLQTDLNKTDQRAVAAWLSLLFQCVSPEEPLGAYLAEETRAASPSPARRRQRQTRGDEQLFTMNRETASIASKTGAGCLTIRRVREKLTIRRLITQSANKRRAIRVIHPLLQPLPPASPAQDRIPSSSSCLHIIRWTTLIGAESIVGATKDALNPVEDPQSCGGCGYNKRE